MRQGESERGEASRLCQANVLIKVVRTHLSDADRTCHKPWPSDAPGPEGERERERAAKNKTHSSCNCFRSAPRARPRLELRLQLAELNKGAPEGGGVPVPVTPTGSSHVLLLMDFQYLQQEVMAAGFMSL